MITEILQQIQTELKAPKSQYNDFGRYHYRNCEDILEALKPILAKHNAAVTLTDDIKQIGNRFYIEATATLYAGGETISVNALAREEETKKGMDGSQITGTASSYARKYALNGLFAIDDTKDADTPQKGADPAPKDDAKAIEATKQYIKDNAAIIAKAKGKTPDEVKAAAFKTIKLTAEPTTLDGLKKVDALLNKWVKQLETNGEN